jgi:hypothetical protein
LLVRVSLTPNRMGHGRSILCMRLAIKSAQFFSSGPFFLAALRYPEQSALYAAVSFPSLRWKAVLWLTTLVGTSSSSETVRRPEEMQFHTAHSRQLPALDGGNSVSSRTSYRGKSVPGGISIRIVQNGAALPASVVGPRFVERKLTASQCQLLLPLDAPKWNYPVRIMIESKRGVGKTVLVVDDYAAIRKLLAVAFLSDGFTTCVQAENGKKRY